MEKIIIKKSECCDGRMIGQTQCEVCGSDGKIIKKIVITGPSGSGKSTLIKKLSPSISEKASDVIQEYPEYTPAQRQIEILKRQIEAEKNIKETTFLDRGIPDVIGFAKYYGIVINCDFYYDLVFYNAKTYSSSVFKKQNKNRVEENAQEAEHIFYNYILPLYDNPIKLPEKNKVDFIYKILNNEKKINKTYKL